MKPSEHPSAEPKNALHKASGRWFLLMRQGWKLSLSLATLRAVHVIQSLLYFERVHEQSAGLKDRKTEPCVEPCVFNKQLDAMHSARQPHQSRACAAFCQVSGCVSGRQEPTDQRLAL